MQLLHTSGCRRIRQTLDLRWHKGVGVGRYADGRCGWLPCIFICCGLMVVLALASTASECKHRSLSSRVTTRSSTSTTTGSSPTPSRCARYLFSLQVRMNNLDLIIVCYLTCYPTTDTSPTPSRCVRSGFSLYIRNDVNLISMLFTCFVRGHKSLTRSPFAVEGPDVCMSMVASDFPRP